MAPSSSPGARARDGRVVHRKIDRKEHQYITHQGCQAIRLATNKGDIDVAAAPESLRKILDVIGPGEERI